MLLNDTVLALGRTVIFGNDTGVCIRGNVILRYDSVPESWISVSIKLNMSQPLVSDEMKPQEITLDSFTLLFKKC